MKRPGIAILTAMAGGVLATLAVRHAISLIPAGTRQPLIAQEASAIYKWMDAWANDHRGELPASVEELKSADYGVEADFLSRVVEYHGAGKNLSSLDTNDVILRCRSQGDGKWEALVYPGGHLKVTARD